MDIYEPKNLKLWRMLRDYAGVSIYAARRDCVPSNDGALDELLRGC